MEVIPTFWAEYALLGGFAIWVWYNQVASRKEREVRDSKFEHIISSLAESHMESLAHVSTRFEHAITSLTASNESVAKKLDGSLRVMSRQINISSQIIIAHDARVRGVNPEVTGDVTEMLDILKKSLEA